MGAISFETLLAFAATCLVIELAPGPNMAYLAVLSASKGRRAGFAATLGIALGLLIVGLAAALGLTAIIANSRWVYEALRWGGVFYLLWLAWEGWRGQDKTSPRNADLTAHDSRFFVRGLVTNLINPKAGIFYVAVLPAFLDEARPLVGQAVTLSAIYVAVATAAHSTIVLLADAARPWLEDERRSTIDASYQNCTGEGQRPDEVSQRSRLFAECKRGDRGDTNTQRDLSDEEGRRLDQDPYDSVVGTHERPPFFRDCSISFEIRLTSSSVSGRSATPSIAATADSIELLKNVRRRCRAADRPVFAGSPVGLYTCRGPDHSCVQYPLSSSTRSMPRTAE